MSDTKKPTSKKSSPKWKAGNMMLITSSWGPTKTFKLIPVDKNCPFLECIFNPSEKILAVIGTLKKEVYHMVERLDDNGEPIKAKVKRTNGSEFRQMRQRMESYNEYYLFEKEDITEFIEAFAINLDYDYKQYLNASTMEAPNQSGILPGPMVEKGDSKLIIT
jgi:hypothetical protein